MTITVTQEDIEHGSRADCSDCPVARGVHRAFPESECVEVDDCRIEVTQWHSLLCFQSPPTVALFITRCDRGFPVQPFTFELV